MQEYMLARETGLVAIPDDLSSVDAAPLLCAGVATFNALKNLKRRLAIRLLFRGSGVRTFSFAICTQNGFSRYRRWQG